MRKRKFKIDKKMIILFSVLAAVAIIGGIVLGYTFNRIKPPDVAIQKEDFVLDESGNPIKMSDKDRKKDFYTFLIVGTDGGVNTDTIMVASLDVANTKANVMSIPRDTMSNVSRSTKKINSAYAVGGIPQLEKELKNIIGIDIDRYILVDLKSFEKIIDAMGGITVDVPDTINIKTGKYTGGMYYDDPAQNLHISLKKGVQTLNGKQAIGFCRFRSGYPDADLGRIKAQQQFINAVAKKVLSPAIIPKIGEITDIVKKNTKSDLSVGEFVWLGKEALKFDPSVDFKTHTLPGLPEYINNISYFIPNEKDTISLVNECFNPYLAPLVRINMAKPSGGSGNGGGNKNNNATSKPKSTSAPATTKKPANTAKPEGGETSAKPEKTVKPTPTPDINTEASATPKPTAEATKTPTPTVAPTIAPTPKPTAEATPQPVAE